MSWLDRFSTHRRRMEDFLDTHRYREALGLLDAAEPDDEEARHAIHRAAALHWLAEADRACRQGDRSRMNSSMAEAARYHHEDFRTAFLETRRRIRDHSLSLTIAPHWCEMLERAAIERNRLHEEVEAPTAFATFSNASMVRELTVERIGNLGIDDLEAAKPRLCEANPDSLHANVGWVPTEFVRAALWVAIGRPDLAVPALLSLPDTEPLVCLERARTAYALGLIGTTMLALGDFAIHHGSHETVRRLNTGVFMAQMAEMVGDAGRAVEILERVPLGQVGRRPVLLLARLYGEIGEPSRGQLLLDTWLGEHPDDVEAEVLRGALHAHRSGK